LVEQDGTISSSSLQQSFNNNAIKISNAREQSITWDENGLLVTSLSDPGEMVKIINGGIFLSADGGKNWRTGVSGSGINTDCLKAGQIDTGRILIKNGKDDAFRWDSSGLVAYWANRDANGKVASYNNNRFVKFDQSGIYGIISDGKDLKAN
jgi:hypothetical protein